jgi:hypothetical protein
MSRMEVLRMPKVRPAKRCWVVAAGRYEDEVLVVETGDVYVVGTVLDDWYVVPPHALKKVLAHLLKAREEDVSLKC